MRFWKYESFGRTINIIFTCFTINIRVTDGLWCFWVGEKLPHSMAGYRGIETVILWYQQ